MEKQLLLKYVAIKPKGFNHYIWFQTDKVIQDCGCFVGENGWGKDGALTNIKMTIGLTEPKRISNNKNNNSNNNN